MAKKQKLGLGLFFNNKTNSGIVNYVYNIVAALKTLEIDKRPFIIVFHNEDAEINILKSIDYRPISFQPIRSFPSNYLTRKLNSAVYKATGINFYKKYFVCRKVSAFYPYFSFLDEGVSCIDNKIEWLVDFNNLFFPSHYPDSGKSMFEYQKKLTSSHKKIILSSYSLLDELKKFFPDYKADIRVLRFVCSLPDFSNVSFEEVKKKHNISGIYFMSPNQFWEHKNQIVVLKALKIIKNANSESDFKILFTGSLEVNRGRGKYAEQLVAFIEQNGLRDMVQFLGVLDRLEQILLMKNSLALIQPSLYEGWSTLVEESKALNKFIILSDLPVHREQINENASFFDPHDEKELSKLMLKCLRHPVTEVDINYKKNITKYAEEIINALLS